MQITADVFGLAVARPHTTETCALGAAINAAVAAGWYKDTDEAAANMTRVERVFEPDSVNVAIYRLGGVQLSKEKEPGRPRGREEAGLVRFSVSMPESLVDGFDRLIEAQGYKTRSEAVRDLIRERLVRREWEEGDQPVAGALTLVYDHHVRGLAEELTRLQHEHIGLVVSALHVHLDHHNCLEVLVMKGEARRLTEVSDRLIATRGVKHGKLTFTTTGEKLA